MTNAKPAIKALTSKQKCLERFRDLSLECAQKLSQGDFGGLKEFLEERDVILKAVDLFDRKLQEALVVITEAPDQEAFKRDTHNKQIQLLQLVEEIRGLDTVLLEKIEQESVRVQEEVAAATRAKDALGRFKSGADDRGEELDHKV